MYYELQGRLHAALARAFREARGQGTVEYVGLKDSTIAEAVIKKLKGAIDSVGEGK